MSHHTQRLSSLAPVLALLAAAFLTSEAAASSVKVTLLPAPAQSGVACEQPMLHFKPLAEPSRTERPMKQPPRGTALPDKLRLLFSSSFANPKAKEPNADVFCELSKEGRFRCPCHQHSWISAFR